jgi:hypothetical protein
LSILDARSLSPVLGRHEGEEGKGRTGHTADNEVGLRGLAAPAATRRDAKFAIGATGVPRVTRRPMPQAPPTSVESGGSKLGTTLPERLWNASLFSEASGPGPPRNAARATELLHPDPGVLHRKFWWPGANRQYHSDQRIGVAELHTTRQIRPTEHAESEGAA